MIKLIKLLTEIIEDKKLNQIALEVRQLYPDVNKGLCFNFSKVLYENLGLDNFIFVYDKGTAFIGEPLHVALKLSNGKYYDGYGVQSQNEFIYEWAHDGIHPDLLSGDIEDLNEYIKIKPEFDKKVIEIINKYK